MTFKPDEKPIITNPFASNEKYSASFESTSGTITAGQEQDVDLVVTKQSALNGIQLIMSGHVTGDSARLQVIYEGQVVNQFATDWFFAGDSEGQNPIVLPIKASILPTMSLRVKYKSTGAQDVKVFVNYFLYEEL